MTLSITPTTALVVAATSAPKTEMGLEIEISSEILSTSAGMSDNPNFSSGVEVPFDITPSDATGKMNILYG